MKMLSNFEYAVREKLKRGDDQDALDVMQISCFCSSQLTFGLLIIVFLFADTIRLWEELNNIGIIIRVISIVVLLFCVIILSEMFENSFNAICDLLITKNAEKQQNDPLKTKDGQGIIQKD